jgi:hypothetical protein
MKSFQISPSDTKISSITTKETVDVQMLNKLISSDLLKETFNNKYQEKIFKNELKQLMEYKKMISFSESNDCFIYIDMKKQTVMEDRMLDCHYYKSEEKSDNQLQKIYIQMWPDSVEYPL